MFSSFKILVDFLRDKEYQELVVTTIAVLIIGTFVYHYIEGWSWLDSFYFSFITLTTIGFGDFAPATDAGKVFTIIYTIAGIGVILGFINAVYQHYSRRGRKRYRDERKHHPQHPQHPQHPHSNRLK
jgi:TRAP-type C4-dicarboxylate transport system permease small subunit